MTSTTKDASVGTEKFSRERFSVLPDMKSRFCQTDASWLRSRSVAVNTDVDPFFGVWRRKRVRASDLSVSTTPRDTQTDRVIMRDVATQVRLCCPLEEVPSERRQSEIVVLEPQPEVEIVITPPPPSPPTEPEDEILDEEDLPLPPPPTSLIPIPSRVGAPSTSDGNSNNPSESDDEDDQNDQEAELMKLRAQKYEQEERYFSKYAARPRKTLKSLKSKNEKKKKLKKAVKVVETSESSEESDVEEEMDIEEESPQPTKKKQKVVRKISNVTLEVPEVPVAQSQPLPPPPPEPAPPELTPVDIVEKEEPTRKAEEKTPEHEAVASSSSSAPGGPEASIMETVALDTGVDDEGSDDKRMVIRVENPGGELKTESKIVIEVINARKREVSEVTSFSEVQNDGRITRKTTVTTSKKVPVVSVKTAGNNPTVIFEPRQTTKQSRKTPEPIITSPPSTRAPSSPVTRRRPATTTIESVAPSDTSSTRPTSAVDEAIIGSFGSTPDMSSFMSPAYSDPEFIKMAKLMNQAFDPYHIVVNRPQETPDGQLTSPQSVSFDESAKQDKEKFSSQERPQETPISVDEGYRTQNASVDGRFGVYWHETTSSTVTNEIVTDPFQDEEGNVQRPRSVTMSTETLIDNSGKDSKITTTSKAKRQFNGGHEEPEISSETSVADVPPILQLEESPHARKSVRYPQTYPAIANGSSAEAETPMPIYSVPDHSTKRKEEKPKPKPQPRSPSRIPRREMSASSPSLDRSARRSDPVADLIRSAIPTNVKSRPVLESSLDDIEGEVQNVLSSPINRESPSAKDKKSRRQKIKESAKQGKLFEDVPPTPIKSKSLSFANLSSSNDEGKEKETDKQSKLDKYSLKMKSTQELTATVEADSRKHKTLKSSTSGTELTTRITRRTHPGESSKGKEDHKRSEMVLEQDIKSGDGVFDNDGCRMTSTIKVDNPGTTKKKKSAAASLLGRLRRKTQTNQAQLMIQNEEKEGRKSPKMKSSKSMGDLRENGLEEENEDEGVMVTSTKFQRVKPTPKTGRMKQETSWEYNLECDCINGLNTSVRTNVRHKRSYVPPGFTLYESSV